MSNTPPLWKAFVVFLAPMTLSNILQSLSGTINSIYLAQMIGVDALAAASVFFPVLFFFIALIMGLSSGATVLISQAWGAGERHRVKAVAGATLTIAVVVAVSVAALGGILSRQLMIALATPPEILDEATTYARIMMAAMPMLFVVLLMASMMRGVGDAVTPLLALTLSTVIGLVVTPALIRGWFGLPALGVASAGWASVVSLTMTLIWLFLHLRARRHPLAPDAELIRCMRLDGGLLRKILRIGLPTAAQLGMISIAELILVGLVNSFGANATAVYGAVNQVLSYVQFPAISIAIAVSIFSAHAIGGGHTDRLATIVRTGLMMNAVLTGGLAALVCAFSHPIMKLFIRDPEVLDLAQGLLHIVLWSVVVYGMAGVFSGTMRASGTVLVPTALSILAIAVVEVPVALILSRIIGVEGIWVAYPAVFCTGFILQLGYYMLIWRKRPIGRLI
jgi:putative MATE family efflux protein